MATATRSLDSGFPERAVWLICLALAALSSWAIRDEAGGGLLEREEVIEISRLAPREFGRHDSPRERPEFLEILDRWEDLHPGKCAREASHATPADAPDFGIGDAIVPLPTLELLSYAPKQGPPNDRSTRPRLDPPSRPARPACAPGSSKIP